MVWISFESCRSYIGMCVSQEDHRRRLMSRRRSICDVISSVIFYFFLPLAATRHISGFALPVVVGSRANGVWCGHFARRTASAPDMSAPAYYARGAGARASEAIRLSVFMAIFFFFFFFCLCCGFCGRGTGSLTSSMELCETAFERRRPFRVRSSNIGR